VQYGAADKDQYVHPKWTGGCVVCKPCAIIIYKVIQGTVWGYRHAWEVVDYYQTDGNNSKNIKKKITVPALYWSVYGFLDC
jgi:hypothetical protein